MKTTRSTKVPAATIRVIWTEGGETPAPFTTFAAFDAWARVIGCPVPGTTCYYKTKFVITWADGQEYTGRVDLDSECMASRTNILAAHILNHLDYVAVNGSAQDKAEAMACVALYQIGDAGDESSAVANNDNGSAVAALLLAMETEETARVAALREAEAERLKANAATHYQGAKYDAKRPLRETATLIRRDLAAAGKLTTGPLAGSVCRVKTHLSRTSRSIDVWIDRVAEGRVPVLNPAYVEADEAGKSPRPSRLSKRGEAITKAVEAIVATYNCEITSTRQHFYSDVRFANELEDAAREEIRATLALLKQA